MNTRRIALPAAAALLVAALAGCSSTGTPTAASGTAAPTSVSATSPAAAGSTAAAAASASDTPSQTASQAAFAGLMTSLGFFPGGNPAYVIDAAGEAVCGSLATQSMSAEISYEDSVDENTLTGMTTAKDIVTFVTDSVEAYCPKYASALPTP